MKIFSFSPFGYEGSLVAVEVDLRRGIPAVDVVGLADGAVKENRERMRSAIRNSGFEFPLERVLISLSPADLKKEGAGFDLALALAVLDAQKGSLSEKSVLVMGELELSVFLLLRPSVSLPKIPAVFQAFFPFLPQVFLFLSAVPLLLFSSRL